jgi:hypothetical protein
MRPFGIGLAAALVIAAFAPAVGISAPKKAEPVSAQARKDGMAEAPAAAQAAGIACKVTDARLVGRAKDPKTKIATNYYEVDCDVGPGFIVQSPSEGAPQTFSCIEVNTPQADGKTGSVTCILPGNQDPKADLAPILAKAGLQCTPTQARGIGQTPKSAFTEVACSDGAGYVVETSTPMDAAKPVSATNCLAYDDADTNIKCILNTKAARLAVVDSYAAAAKDGCAIKDRRFVGMSQTGSSFFEVSCNDGKGYMYKVEKGQFAQSYPCEKATMMLGGCTLTDAREAETAQAGLYTRLSKSAGYDCDVAKYATFPAPPGKDVVEISCSNRPDGGIGVFGGPNDKPIVYDCARSVIAGYRCSFTKPEAGYKAMTADLKSLGKNECEVSNTRAVGKTAKGTTMMEVACADGLKGYILEYSAEPLKAVGVMGCAFTKDCKLPGNI